MPIAFALSPTLINGLTDRNQAPNLANAITRGQVQTILLAGRNPAAPTASLGDIWGYPNVASGQQVRAIPTAGYTLAVISDSVLDAYSVGSSGGSASFATNVMTLTVAPTTGAIGIGQVVVSAGVTAGTYISALASGTINQVGSTYTLSTSPGTITAQAVSTTAATGAFMVGVSYLDTLYNPNTAVFVLNGQTAVTVAAQINGSTGGTITNCLRIQGVEVVSTGTGLANAGNIFLCDSSNTYSAGVPVTTTKVFDCVLIGDNSDASSQYTIPAGFYGMVVQLMPTINDVTATAKYAKTVLGTTTGANGIFLRFDLGGVSSNNNPVPINLSTLPIIQPKSDVRIQCQCSATTEVACANFLIIWPVS